MRVPAGFLAQLQAMQESPQLELETTRADRIFVVLVVLTALAFVLLLRASSFFRRLGVCGNIVLNGFNPFQHFLLCFQSCQFTRCIGTLISDCL